VTGQARSAGAQIYVCGHAHVPFAKESDGVLYLNPGAIASGNSYTRQTVQSVALLLLCTNGDKRVEHINLATGKRGDVPVVDWQAGFAAAHSKVSDILVSPADLARLRDAFRITGEDWPVLDEAVLRCAWRRWRGRDDLITLNEIVRELRADPQTPQDLVEWFARNLPAERLN
jgi:hypothetical protein